MIKKFAASLFLATALCAAQQPQQPRQVTPPAAQGKQAKPETHISQQDAQKLFASIDEVFQFVSKDTGLPIKHPVAKKLANRDEVQKYIESKMAEDEDTKRFERSAIVLKKFGLIPRDFELRPFLIKMMRDQVAGFYDVKTKTAYLLDWIEPDLQKPVMAHELTHALQDQNFDLDKWAKDKTRDDAEKRGEYDRAVELDENSTAQTAMVEGQGMITLVDYMLKDYGHTAADSPEVVRMMSSQIDSDNSSEVLKSAPMLLRESLVFPYRDGMKFVGAVLRANGKDAAFSGMFSRPPKTSYEVLTPSAYLQSRPIPSLRLPDMKALLGDAYSEYDLGAMGEFDAELLLKQFGDDDDARTISRDWDGGSYFAALRKGATPDKTSSIALMYVSRWKTPDAASAFAKTYAGSIATKYKKVAPAECSPCEDGERRWNTDEGYVEVAQRGNKVIVLEGFEEPLAVKIKEAALSGSGQQMSADMRDLSIRVVPQWVRAMIAPSMLRDFPPLH
ncbi:MAG TPA: hypothetical protein VGC88_02675 [Terriglobales bacterium]|jgi:hypothetical protein